jgi:hypothetical protein
VAGIAKRGAFTDRLPSAQVEHLEDVHNGSSDSLTSPICTINILLTAATLSSMSSSLVQRGSAEKG